MHSPPQSSSSDAIMGNPFQNTSGRFGGQDSEAESLIERAARVRSLNHGLVRAIESNKAGFFNMFQRRIRLIKSRFQTRDETQVSIYDRVLLVLTMNGNELETPAAITWYCKEFLGFEIDTASTEEIIHAVHESVEFSTTLDEATAVQSLARQTSTNDSAVRGQAEVSADPLDNDARFQQLWSVFIQARAEYFVVASDHNRRTLEAAKFLRDTAENGIQYLENKVPGHPAVKEFQGAIMIADRAVLELNGGKKRRFDTVAAEHGPGDRRRVQEPVRGRHGDRGDRREERGRGGHARRQPRRGRGPSGIPYGYSRPVDSYHPV